MPDTATYPRTEEDVQEPEEILGTELFKQVIDREYIHRYMEAAKTASGYSDIYFSELPEHIGGVTLPEIEITGNGIEIAGSEIQINDRYDRDLNPEEFNEYIESLNHEINHGIWFEKETKEEYSFSEKEREYSMLLMEGQAAFNTDGETYSQAKDLYSEIYQKYLEEEKNLDRLIESAYGEEDEGETAGQILEDLSQEKYLAYIDFEDGEYDFAAIDREDIPGEDLSEQELFSYIENTYRVEIDRENSYTIDFSEEDIDEEKIGEHLIETQEEVDQYMAEMDIKGYELPNRTETPGAENYPVSNTETDGTMTRFFKDGI